MVHVARKPRKQGEAMKRRNLIEGTLIGAYVYQAWWTFGYYTAGIGACETFKNVPRNPCGALLEGFLWAIIWPLYWFFKSALMYWAVQ